MPIITIDGPSGCGKGTLALRLAEALQWYYLDSGVLYRIVAWLALNHGLDVSLSPAAFKKALAALDYPQVKQGTNQWFFKGEDITDALRTQACSQKASELGALPKVREALLDQQRSFPQTPGLVTDGRDMGTVIFPNADLKIFLTASLEERALRRFRQLKGRGIDVSLADVRSDLSERDHRDTTRDVSPLRPSEDAWILDNTALSFEETFEQCLSKIKAILKR